MTLFSKKTWLLLVALGVITPLLIAAIPWKSNKGLPKLGVGDQFPILTAERLSGE